MNAQRELTVQVRKGIGKGEARKLRASGRAPGVLYGQGAEHLSIAFDPAALRKAIDPTRKLNTWFSLRIQEEGKPDRVESAIIADHQLDKVKDFILHVDFLRVDPAKELQVRLPVEYTGRSVGVVAGGSLKTFARYIHVSVKPGDVPPSFVVDVTPMQSGQTLRVRDMTFPAGKILDNPNGPLAFIEPPKAKKEEPADAKKKDAKDAKKK